VNTRHLKVALSDETAERLASLASQTGGSIDGCVQQAIDEFLGAWEDYMRMVAVLGQDEARPQLTAA
jgi:predicted DNA-binding protein